MTTKLMQIKEDENGVQTASYSEYEDGARTVALDNPLGEPADLKVLFDSLAPGVVEQADSPADDPDTARMLDETHDADPENPVAQSSGDYVANEMKKYNDSKPKAKGTTTKGKARH